MEKVKVTLNLLPEAAQILSQYASERTRGDFVSGLLLAQRSADDAEGARLFVELQTQRQAADATVKRAQEAAAAAVARFDKRFGKGRRK